MEFIGNSKGIVQSRSR